MTTRPIFGCARCHKPSLLPGRKARLIRGVRVFVCARCVADEPKREAVTVTP